VIASTVVIPDLPVDLVYSGKVRDTYELTGDRFLMVATDRVSAFDVILPSTIPNKGVVLTQLSRFWFARTSDIVSNHLTGESVASLGWPDVIGRAIASRSMIVRKADRVPIECVVRGYMAGSGWVEYQRTGSVGGHSLPTNLRNSDRLPEPLFAPARKNDTGHDENITIAQMENEVGAELTTQLAQISIALYSRAAAFAIERGVIIADTKFEFGYIDGLIHLIDEVLTPDSSRFWDAARWHPGREAESFDKQFVRNWLLGTDWNKEPPAPELPEDIIRGTVDRYTDAFQRLTGASLETWIREQEEIAKA
jgi:phosphoribosylaminoimidazole-succinocarboxamide synthase